METQTETNPGLGQELVADAKGVGSSAVNRLHSEVDNRKGEAVTQVKSISSAIDRAAEGLDGNAPDWLKSAFTQGAQQVQKFADALEQKDSRQLVGEISDFARKSPMTFLAACAAAGFAASRVFQAGSKANVPNQPKAVGMGADADSGPANSGYSAQPTEASTSFAGQAGGQQAPAGGQQAPAGGRFA